jgi:hypothetical protein
MFNRNDEYINATKNARINTYDSREISVRVWFINFSLFSLLMIGSYYSYHYYNNTKHHATIVMGVSHTDASDNDLMVKLYDIKVDKLTVKRDKLSISDAMKKIIDNSSLEDSSRYVEELATEVDNSSKSKIEKITFEKQISDELKLIN